MKKLGYILLVIGSLLVIGMTLYLVVGQQFFEKMSAWFAQVAPVQNFIQFLT